MSTAVAADAAATAQREPELAGQTVVLIGGSAGIGLETARRARAEGAKVVLTGRDPDRLRQAAAEVGAERTAAFDATDATAVQKFFQELPAPIDHVLVTAGGPTYGPLLEMGADQVREAVGGHIVVGLDVARSAAAKMRPGGTLVLMGGTGGRRVGPGLGIAPAATDALPPFVAALALEIAPVRVNLIAAGFVDTPLSASLLGDHIEERRQELRDTLPIGRVVTAVDVAKLAVHLMSNTAVTGATYDIDGGQQFVWRPPAAEAGQPRVRSAPDPPQIRAGMLSGRGTSLTTGAVREPAAPSPGYSSPAARQAAVSARLYIASSDRSASISWRSNPISVSCAWIFATSSAGVLLAARFLAARVWSGTAPSP
jgi:NAD(P)-dependent dehydrogenase (short-subunit alcohol dehydrogenase family)